MNRTSGMVELELPVGIDAKAVLIALSRSDRTAEYFLYSNGTETRIALGCAARVTVASDAVVLDSANHCGVSEPVTDPFEQVPRLLSCASSSPWTAYGYVSFDVARHYFHYARKPDVPELVFTVPESEIIIRGQRATLRGARASELGELLQGLRAGDEGDLRAPVHPEVDHALRGAYETKVGELICAIRAGELSKAILSRRVVFDGELDVPATYASASRVNSGVRSFAFRTPSVAGVGFSPEVLLQADSDGTVTTCLLAGTRPRGKTPEEDERLRSELFGSAKEVKEHAISVQLAQEEISSVCTPDTVRIFEFMNLKKFRSVQHLGTKLSGKLRENLTAWSALRVLFPAITVAGVPKAEALSRIGALEEYPRGVYGGVVGFVDSEGRMDLTLAIRAVFEYSGRVHLNAGAGIVAESEPGAEYFESVNKMNMMLGQTILEPMLTNPRKTPPRCGNGETV